MSSSAINDFLQGDSNTYNFKLVSIDENVATMSIDDDYQFQINLNTFQVSSNDEFLIEWVTLVNSFHFVDVSSLLTQCVKSYDKFLGVEDVEESPLYIEGQQVFELENDNFDLKFVSRMRISEDDFNSDLLLNVFAFLTPQNTMILGRVSKLWYKLTSNETLWKQYFKDVAQQEGIEVRELDLDSLEGDSLKLKYGDYFSRSNGTILWDSTRHAAVSVTLDTTQKMATFNNQGKVIGFKSPHFTMKIVNCSWMMYGFVTETEMQSIVLSTLDTYDFSKGYLIYNSGGAAYGSHQQQSIGTGPLTGFVNGDTVGAYHDIIKGEIYMQVNGVNNASWSGEYTELYPIVIVSGNATVELIETPKNLIPKSKYKKFTRKNNKSKK
jgi:hypothetical protein